MPRVLLQGPHDVPGIFLGLVFIEQRHDLRHHDVHGVIPHFLCDRDQLHAVLRQLANVELKLEVIAEEAAERMDHDHIEGRRLRLSCLDHALELGAAIMVADAPGSSRPVADRAPRNRLHPAASGRESTRHVRPAAPSRHAGKARRRGTAEAVTFGLLFK